ncbi:uncharacterized protein LACBIDRAFT_308414 [Laccaria bicolor S238N-H82]|uniref:Predicted protein n=1 Tax=Laccaria bicolor (strain S238N-H82 / ATCC MYA-4686) TaxID=486041 RepID=B0CW89_LACBS|nr:uncharacterized protein LACBIDRAFT_308414 [Laccaria bicolor S238N-H82]EDR13467.1 predicted protein [Laccaria bicolor S238N-H82]|eukprot:XP_001875965.1 predicted protein [Laccaria bicolor S238N-H82]
MQIAHNSTIPALGGNMELRPLQDLITAEKAVLILLQKLSVYYSKATEALRRVTISVTSYQHQQPSYPTSPPP